jgi:RNA polymerase sigma factor (sigma-70 family)
LLLANLGVLHRLVELLAHRHRLTPVEAEDLEAYVRLRLVDNDFQVLRSFEGRSSLPTYLTVVVQRIFRDFRTQAWGKWRASAAVVRQGPVATELEALIYRDGYTFAEACQVLLVSRKVAATEAQLRELWDGMPLRYARVRRRVPEPGEREALVDPAPSPEQVALQRQIAAHIGEALGTCLRALPDHDRLLLRLRFGEGLAAPAIAQALGRSRKAIYGRIQDLAKRLRRELRRAGVAAGDVRRLLADGEHTAAWDELIADATSQGPVERAPRDGDERDSRPGGP